jgi:formate dehydrogenase major subunit
MVDVTIDGDLHLAQSDERLIDLINRVGNKLPQVCYHPQLGPIQTCDTCMVEINGQLVRACATTVGDGMEVLTKSEEASTAHREAFNRILSNTKDSYGPLHRVSNDTGWIDVRISTCVKGKFAWDYVNIPDRLTKPLIRDGNKFREAAWEEALDLVARKFKEIKAQNGPDSLAFVSSSKCTNEESYLMQKLARAVIGTNNMDNCSCYCPAPATAGLFRTVGYGGDSGSIEDIESAGLVIIVGSNTAASHPVIATRVKSAHKLRGQKLIVVDLREHEMAKRADLFIHPNPGTDLVWLSAISRYLLENGLVKRAFLEQWVLGLEDYKASLAPFTMEFAAQKCGISEDTLRRVAHMIAEADGLCILWAKGITQHSMGSDSSTAISNLLPLTGNYGRPGAGAYPLRGHNNVQGASDHGTGRS